MRPLVNVSRLLFAVGLAATVSCSSQSPTEPSTTAPTPKPPVPQVTYTITVTASPGRLQVGTASSTQITVIATRSDNGQPVPDLTPVTLTTTLGEFGSAGSAKTSLSLQTVGGRAQAVLFPGTNAGTATIQAQISVSGASGTGATTVLIDTAGTFFLSSVSPAVGNPAGGDQVTLNGGGFQGPVKVLFGSAAAQVLSVSPSKIVVVVPAAVAAGVTVGVGQTVPVPVTVTINANQTGQAQDSLANGFTYALGGTQQPQVFSVTPASGGNDGGTTISIAGQGFQAPVQVFFGSGSSATAFNGVEATVQSVTPNRILAISPPARGFGQNNVDQVVSILVKNLSNGFFAIAPQSFKYGSQVLVTSIAPGDIIYDIPTKVTIFGQGFEDPVAVSLAGVAAQVLQVSGTEIQVLSPEPTVRSCQSISGPVHVTNIQTGVSADGPTFNFRVVAPSISSLTPSSGPAAGGTTVTINGSFDVPAGQSRMRVQIGQQTVGVVSASPSQLVVVTPPFTGTFSTVPCFVGTTAGTMNVSTSVDVTVTDVVTTCNDKAVQAFTYIPADTSCRVPPPPPPPPVVKPVASFTFTKSGLSVLVTDTSTNNPTSWAWDFGDGGMSNQQSPPAHTYAVAGTYQISLTVSNSAGSSTTRQFVTVP
ncbi:MAG: IPT/TIG domain-containing protein [Acidobacteriota bacterium]|nr:IPT/TIG domain-containing protein [Acidobacteriota bacterium]